MDIVAFLLLTAGVLGTTVGGIWYMIATFRKSIWWGLGNLFVPFVSLVFLIVHFQSAWKPFLISLVGGMLIGGGFGAYAASHPELMAELSNYAKAGESETADSSSDEGGDEGKEAEGTKKDADTADGAAEKAVEAAGSSK
jgi:hypothetical protein